MKNIDIELLGLQDLNSSEISLNEGGLVLWVFELMMRHYYDNAPEYYGGELEPAFCCDYCSF